ncbi:MAG: DNA polymerase Y family protein, partial [Chloroflexi bacterium]|nr:DNA polymerase Y family protein [Chloroflexota bacterium]
MRLLHLYWPHLPIRLARSRHSDSFPTDRPVVLGGQPWTDGLVIDADPAARALGVRRGIPLGSAHRLAPEAAFLEPETDQDMAAAEAAFETLARFSPGLAGTTDPTDPAFGLIELQADGLDRLWGPDAVLVQRLVEALATILPGAPQPGIAGTRFAATVAAGHAEPAVARIVEPGGDAHFLAPLPSKLLSPDPDVRARLARFGLRRIGVVADLPKSALVARFGAEGERIHARARGEELERFVPRRAPERVILALPIDPPVAETESLRFVLHRLSGALAAQIDARGMAAGRATLRLTLELAFARTGTPQELVVEQRFPEPTADADAIERLLLARLEQTPPPAAIERLELELAGV